MNPHLLSWQLRNSQARHMANRRGVVVCSLLSVGCMGLISLYQIGVLRHLPEPPIAGLDADKVVGSDEAYSHLQVGDAFLGMVSFSVTAALAGMGSARRAKTLPWLPVLAAAKAGFDTVQAARLTYSEFARQRAGCFWCLLAAASTVATAVFSVPEAMAARKTLCKGR